MSKSLHNYWSDCASEQGYYRELEFIYYTLLELVNVKWVVLCPVAQTATSLKFFDSHPQTLRIPLFALPELITINKQ